MRIWYRRTKDLMPFFDSKAHLFENSLLKMLAQLYLDDSVLKNNDKAMEKTLKASSTQTYRKTSHTTWTLNIKMRVICHNNSYNKFKVQVVWLVFYKFRFNIVIWKISLRLLVLMLMAFSPQNYLSYNFVCNLFVIMLEKIILYNEYRLEINFFTHNVMWRIPFLFFSRPHFHKFRRKILLDDRSEIQKMDD